MMYRLDDKKRNIYLQIPKNAKLGHVNNQKVNLTKPGDTDLEQETMDFRFTELFDQDASQEDIFERVAKPVTLK